MDFKNIFAGGATFDRILIPTLAVSVRPLYDTLKKSGPGKLLVLIGPEGDFTKEEAAVAVSFGAVPVSLGPLILRTETAAMFFLSACSFFYREICNSEKPHN